MDTSQSYKAIVIGTSAGGFSALSQLLQDLPEDYALPVVVVQHRTSDQQDLLEELLQVRCRIRVRQAEEKDQLGTGTVYIAPPAYHLLVEEDQSLSLSADDRVNYSRPSIDVLFESAARAFKKELVAILLTGSNNDGSHGIRMVRQNGGVTIVQDPVEAEFPVMPSAAIATQQVNFTWRLDDILKFMLQIHVHQNGK